MIENIYHEINNPYPAYIDLYIHELDKCPINIYFLKEGQAFDVDVSNGGSYEAIISITIDNLIVCDNISAEATENQKGIKLDFESYGDLKLAPGLMKIEITIKERSVSNNQNSASETQKSICPICPINIKVKASILNESSGTLESVGSVSELLSMLTSIRGLINDPVPNNSVGQEELTEELQEEINNKMDAVFVIGSNTVFNENVDFNKIYYTTLGGVDYRFYVVLDDSEHLKAQYRESVNGIEKRNYDTASGTWDEFINIHNGHLSCKELSAPLTSYSNLSACNETKTLYIGSISGALATALDVSGYICVMKVAEIQYIWVLNTAQRFKCTYNDAESTMVEIIHPTIATFPRVIVWDYSTTQSNNNTVPTNYEGKIGDFVVTTTGTGTGGKVFICTKIVSAYGSFQYYWEEITLASRVSALEETVGTLNTQLENALNGVS